MTKVQGVSFNVPVVSFGTEFHDGVSEHDGGSLGAGNPATPSPKS